MQRAQKGLDMGWNSLLQTSSYGGMVLDLGIACSELPTHSERILDGCWEYLLMLSITCKLLRPIAWLQ